ASAVRRRCAPWVRRTAATRSPSSFPAIASSARAATSRASAAACRSRRRCCAWRWSTAPSRTCCRKPAFRRRCFIATNRPRAADAPRRAFHYSNTFSTIRLSETTMASHHERRGVVVIATRRATTTFHVLDGDLTMQFSMVKRGAASLAALGTAVAAFAVPALVQAQGLADDFLDEIIVTGTKRAGGIDVQDAPVAISAYGENQLDAMHLRDLSSLGFVAPSVQLEDIGTTRGTANFSIRGIGINSSIPSIDPAGGVVLDVFDLEGVEVLRGPQGLLFGRNVTGGAVLLRTSRPTEQLSVKAKVAAETGLNQFYQAVVSGPLADGHGGKLAVYHNSD